MSDKYSGCPLCWHMNPLGIRVCGGTNCGASIQYGITARQVWEAFWSGAGLIFLALVLLPMIIADSYQNMPVAILMKHFGAYGILIVLGIGALAGFCCIYLSKRAKRNQVLYTR